MKDVLTHLTKHETAKGYTPYVFNWATDFAEESNQGGKAIIKNIASTVNGEDLQVTFQVNDIDKNFYKNSPYKNEVTNPLAKGKSIFVKLDKTSLANEALDVSDPAQRITAESIYLVYRSEKSSFTTDDIARAIFGILGALKDASGSSLLTSITKGVLVPKGC